MLERLLFVVVLVLVFGYAHIFAAEQSKLPCGPRHVLIANLSDERDQYQTYLAMNHLGFTVEVWMSLDRSSWTIIATNNDFGCVTAYGINWRNVEGIWDRLRV